MHRALLSAVLSLSILLSTLVAAQDASYTFTTIDVPGFRWTVAGGLNGAGDIVGSYLDVEGGQHGFLDNGTSMVTFDVPGARYTVPHGINSQGVIVGQYTDSLGVHGFVTADRVNFTTINYPVAIETFTFAINDHGAIVGSLNLSGIGGRGFMLVNGEFTILEVPGASDTSAYGINNDGHIVGSHQFGDSQVHGFLLVDGQYTTIDHPGALYTLAFGINDTGVLVGWYTGSTQHGFVWINGTFTTVDVPNGTQSAVHGINGGGSLVGSYVGLDPGLSHGFLATPEPGDTSPPTITVSASPTTLSPPNGRLVIVTVSGTITDEPDGSGVQTSTYQVIDEYGQVQPRGSVIPGANGRYTFTVALQASRRGNDPDGRHYTITVSASDMAGNVDDASATVTVPRN